MKYNIRTLIFAFSVVFAVSCSKEESIVDDPWNPSLARTLTNEKYGPGPRDVMDVYLAAERNGTTRVLITVHGGGWNSGDKADMNAVVQAILAADPSLAVVNINYTLADGNEATRHPAQMQDIDEAVAYVRSQESLWNTGNNISMLGVSAGAHMCMLYAYSFDDEKIIKSVIDIVGPSNLSGPFYTNNIIFQSLAKSYLGATWQENPALHQSLSPVNFVTAQSPPTLMAYAGQDLLVPASNATAIRNAFQQAPATYQYYFYPNDPHELTPATVTDILGKVIPFLNTYGR